MQINNAWDVKVERYHGYCVYFCVPKKRNLHRGKDDIKEKKVIHRPVV